MGRWDPRPIGRDVGRPEEPDALEADVDLLPFDDTDPDYLQRRRDAQAAHYRQQHDAARRRAEHPGLDDAARARAAATAAAWEQLLGDLHRGDDFATGAGDRTLF